jgi:hypothetical protein
MFSVAEQMGKRKNIDDSILKEEKAMKPYNLKRTIVLVIGILLAVLVVSCEIPTYALRFAYLGGSYGADTTDVNCEIENIGFKELPNARIRVGVNIDGTPEYFWSTGITLAVGQLENITIHIIHTGVSSVGPAWIDGSGWDD